MIEKCLESLQLKNFRCFESVEFHFQKPIILIQGTNGSGKTSLLEALHYLCYLRSFRTHVPREMTRFGAEGFFIKAIYNDQEIKVGCVGNKRHVRIDQKNIESYHELRKVYRIVTVTDDDLGLIKEGPDKRRAFLDHALLLYNPELLSLFQNYKHILESRNALLHRFERNKEELEIWTKQLWELTQKVQHERILFLEELRTALENPLTKHWQDRSLILEYSTKKRSSESTWQEFYTHWTTTLIKDEYFYKRSLFGTHLDDVIITFDGKPAKLYSSRGQQKLIVFLIKMAQISLLIKKQGSAIFLLDDFMSDFDEQTMHKLINACSELKTQLIFTTPTSNGIDSQILLNHDTQIIKLDF